MSFIIIKSEPNNVKEMYFMCIWDVNQNKNWLILISTKFNLFIIS